MPDPVPNAAVLDALGNPTRRDMLARLQGGPLNVNQLTQHYPMSRPAVSKHLKILREADLVTVHANGTRNEYALNPTGFDAARAWLDAFWDTALARFKIVAENTSK